MSFAPSAQRTLPRGRGRQPRGTRKPAGGRPCLRAQTLTRVFLNGFVVDPRRPRCLPVVPRVSENLGPPQRAPIARAHVACMRRVPAHSLPAMSSSPPPPWGFSSRREGSGEGSASRRGDFSSRPGGSSLRRGGSASGRPWRTTAPPAAPPPFLPKYPLPLDPPTRQLEPRGDVRSGQKGVPVDRPGRSPRFFFTAGSVPSLGRPPPVSTTRWALPGGTLLHAAEQRREGLQLQVDGEITAGGKGGSTTDDGRGAVALQLRRDPRQRRIPESATSSGDDDAPRPPRPQVRRAGVLARSVVPSPRARLSSKPARVLTRRPARGPCEQQPFDDGTRYHACLHPAARLAGVPARALARAQWGARWRGGLGGSRADITAAAVAGSGVVRAL